MNSLSALLKKYNCIDIHIDIIGSVTLNVIGNYDGSEIVDKAFPISDFVYIDDFPLLMDRLNEFSASPLTRMYTHFRLELDKELHWAYLCCHKSSRGGFDGVLLDAYEYLDCIPNDNVVAEFEQRQSKKISELNNNSATLEEIVGRDYLIKIQAPFLGDEHISSAILNENGRVICTADASVFFNEQDFSFIAKKEIKFNFKTGGYWVIGSDDEAAFGRAERYLSSLSESLSRIAHSIIALYNEMENSRAVNRQLGANVEEQMLVNSMQSIIMEETRAEDALERVLDLAGAYLKLDVIIAVSDGIDENSVSCRWFSGGTDDFGTCDYIMSNYAEIHDEFSDLDNYFSSENDKNKVLPEKGAFAVSKLIDSDGGSGLIVYGSYKETANRWSYNDRKLIRNVSQVISSIIYRCKTEREIESINRRLYNLAFYDTMLGIKNRSKLDADVNEAISYGKSGIVMAVQILNTRFLNEVFGQSYTDKLLRLIADFFSEDSIAGELVYRYSGSIMMLVLAGKDAEYALSIVHKIIDRFRLPFYVDNVEQYAEAVIGIAPYDDSTATEEDLYRSATLSLYRANEYGKNSYAFYNNEFKNAKGSAYDLETELRRCIADNMRNFEVVYQPAFSLDGGIDHFEALLRWKSDTHGNVSPKVFMQLMEKVGLDVSIDFWVLPRACAFCKRIRELLDTDVRVSINLTTHEMQSGALPAKMQNFLAEVGLDGSTIIVEIPEASHISAYNDTASTLGKLKKLGVNVCIDSFGNEYLPLNILKNSYIDAIKINSSFITNAGDSFDETLLETTVSLAKSKNVEVYVKSIEHKVQYEISRKLGVHCIQGGLFARPKTEDEIIDELTTIISGLVSE